MAEKITIKVEPLYFDSSENAEEAKPENNLKNDDTEKDVAEAEQMTTAHDALTNINYVIVKSEVCNSPIKQEPEENDFILPDVETPQDTQEPVVSEDGVCVNSEVLSSDRDAGRDTSVIGSRQIESQSSVSTTNKRRRVIHSEGRSIIASVYHFLREEYEFTKTFMEHKNCDLSHLRDITRRTAEATGVCTKTVQRILKEEKEMSSSSSKFTSPKKKKKGENKIEIDVTADVVQ